MVHEQLAPLQPGDIIAGKFEIINCVRVGSVGTVYTCLNRELGKHLVALKVLSPDLTQDRIASARFHNEVLSSYSVSHRNVVRVFEYIQEQGLTAYTMEYIRGGDLADLLQRSKALPVAATINILGQLCTGVQAMHEEGIVHRDLKPENILLTQKGVIKITDFGIACSHGGRRLTQHGGVVGTVDYLSPEYLLHSRFDWRSDIYALGIIGYEMITGSVPFRGDSIMASMKKRLDSKCTPPSALSECPPELERILFKAMEVQPDKRFQSAAEMLGDLEKHYREYTEVNLPLHENLGIELLSDESTPSLDFPLDASIKTTSVVIIGDHPASPEKNPSLVETSIVDLEVIEIESQYYLDSRRYLKSTKEHPNFPQVRARSEDSELQETQIADAPSNYTDSNLPLVPMEEHSRFLIIVGGIGTTAVVAGIALYFLLL